MYILSRHLTIIYSYMSYVFNIHMIHSCCCSIFFGRISILDQSPVGDLTRFPRPVVEASDTSAMLEETRSALKLTRMCKYWRSKRRLGQDMFGCFLFNFFVPLVLVPLDTSP